MCNCEIVQLTFDIYDHNCVNLLLLFTSILKWIDSIEITLNANAKRKSFLTLWNLMRLPYGENCPTPYMIMIEATKVHKHIPIDILIHSFIPNRSNNGRPAQWVQIHLPFFFLSILSLHFVGRFFSPVNSLWCQYHFIDKSHSFDLHNQSSHLNAHTSRGRARERKRDSV